MTHSCNVEVHGKKDEDANPSLKWSTENIFSQSYVDIEDYFRISEEIGRGSLGTVKKCYSKSSGELRACKIIFKSELKSQLDIDDIISEGLTLQAMQFHPCVVELSGIFEDSERIIFVLRYCEGGDLFDRIKEKSFFSENYAAAVIGELASVLACAHERGIMHRDIKLENVLLTSKDSDTNIRLADFGSAAMFSPGQKLKQLVGSPLYIAPSVLQQNYGTEADLWSLGVVMYILLCGSPPFFASSRSELFWKIQHAPLNFCKGRIGLISPEALHLLKLLLNRDSNVSFTGREILSHPWILRYGFGLAKEGVVSSPIGNDAHELCNGGHGVGGRISGIVFQAHTGSSSTK